METYAEARELVENPDFRKQKRTALQGLTDDMIDPPIRDIIRKLNGLPHCFTLQCCYGHFVYEGQSDPHNLERLPATDDISEIEYRLAYVAFCVDNNDAGRRLLDRFREIATGNSEYVQFLSAEWFWERQVNSYAVQVMPDRHKNKDTAMINYREALQVQAVRDRVYEGLMGMF